MSQSLLLDQRIVVIQPALVKELGHITDAAVLQQLHYWMPRARSEHDGFLWVYKTYDEWSEEIGITPKQVRSAMQRLEDHGLVISCQPEAYHRRKWYRIDYSHDLLYSEPHDQPGDTIRPYGRLEETSRADRIDQTGASITETTTYKTSDTKTKPQTSSAICVPEDTVAADLANLLADLIEGNGSKRPSVTGRWVTAIDRMIRIDGRTPEQVENAMRWAQASDFWSANILSPDKLRKHYDRMRLQAQRDQNVAMPKGISGVREYLAGLDAI